MLINNAGIGTAVPATRETPDEFRRVIDINLNGSYFMAQACARAMRGGTGSIVNIGSVLGSTTASLPQAAYASSKAAIIGLTRDLAQQWTGRKGIRVNALAPGFFESEMTGQYPDGYIEQMMVRVPAGRKGEPHELAAAAIFFASDASSYITGTVLPVDGGLLTTSPATTRSPARSQRSAAPFSSGLLAPTLAGLRLGWGPAGFYQASRTSTSMLTSRRARRGSWRTGLLSGSPAAPFAGVATALGADQHGLFGGPLTTSTETSAAPCTLPASAPARRCRIRMAESSNFLAFAHL